MSEVDAPAPSNETGQDKISYRCWSSIFGGEVTWTLTGAVLASSAGVSVAFPGITSIRVHDAPGLSTLGGQPLVEGASRCLVSPAHGRTIRLTNRHFLGLGRFEDRSDTFVPFVQALLHRVTAANHSVLLLTGMTRALWWVWGATFLVCLLVTALAVAMIVEMFQTGRWFSWDMLMVLPMTIALCVSALSIARLLLRGKTRRLELS